MPCTWVFKLNKHRGFWVFVILCFTRLFRSEAVSISNTYTVRILSGQGWFDDSVNYRVIYLVRYAAQLVSELV